MIKNNVMRPLARANAFVVAATLAVSALLPAVLLSSSAQGVQLGTRFIDMSATQTSEGSGRDSGDAAGEDVTYSVSFTLSSGHSNIEGVVIDFCDNSPITGDPCTAPSGFDLDASNLASTFDGGDDDLAAAGWAIDTGNSTANTLIITDAVGTGNNLPASTVVEFDLGSTGAADGIDNPDSAGTFYARILTYTDDTVAAAYVPGTPGAYLDDGGVALSVANELTVTARVQEVLEFCIGTEDDSADTGGGGLGNNGAQDGSPANREATDDCSDVSGTALDLGVVDSGNIQRTSDNDIGDPAVAGNGNDGVAMIRTNASSGAVMYYKAEQEAIGTQPGTLRQTGVNDCGTAGAVNNACFNSAGGPAANPSQTLMSVGTELFGVTLTNQDESAGGNTTDALSCDAEYNGDGSCAAGQPTEYAWDETGAFDTLASSSGPIDDEMVNIEFAATASPTTPTGLYTVTANFVATSTF